jgi:small subunit ribosomal protein S9
LNDEPNSDVTPEEPSQPEDASSAEPETAATEGQSEEQSTRMGSTEDAPLGSSADAPSEPDSEAEAPEPEPVAEPAPSEVAGEAPSGAPAAEEQEAPAAAPAAQAPAPEAEEEAEELPETPRVKPEIPGLELEPDLIAEADQYLDAEAQAAAEAEAEALAARARAEADDDEASPIADAAIDLAAGARYTATGKRKTAVARVIVKPGTGTYSINGKALETMFPRETLQRMIRQPLETVGYEARMDVVARMHGGGVSAQAGALRHGISRALIVADPNLRGELKRRGFLTRDPRVKERKKAGLKKARKRPQFSKR